MSDAVLKPKLRGWFHLGMAPLVQLAGLILLVVTPTLVGRVGVAVYLVAATLLFGISAVYHLGRWRPETTAVLRRLDHANIFVFIAGTYTPLALMLLEPPQATLLLGLVWGIAIVGITVKMVWMAAPRWLYTMLYIGMGWVAVGWLLPFWRSGGPAVVALIVLGGLVYSAGAFVYARKRPDPFPAWFGFHEIFHACTVVAALCHFAAITIAVLR